MARIPDSTRDTYPDDLKYVWDKLARDGAGRPANIFVAMGNNPALVRAYTRFGNDPQDCFDRYRVPQRAFGSRLNRNAVGDGVRRPLPQGD